MLIFCNVATRDVSGINPDEGGFMQIPMELRAWIAKYVQLQYSNIGMSNDGAGCADYSANANL